MAVERVGTAYLSNIYATSLSITVPNDAELAIIYGKDYAEPTGVPLIGSTSATLVRKHIDINNGPLIGLYYIISPPSGSQTLYFGTPQGFSDSYYYGVAFYNGVKTSDPILSSAVSLDDTDITGLIAGAGSMMVGIAAGSYSIPTVTDNGQTQLALETGHGFGVAQLASSTTFNFTGTNLNAMALTIAPKAAVSLPIRTFNHSFLLVR